LDISLVLVVNQVPQEPSGIGGPGIGGLSPFSHNSIFQLGHWNGFPEEAALLLDLGARGRTLFIGQTQEPSPVVELNPICVDHDPRPGTHRLPMGQLDQVDPQLLLNATGVGPDEFALLDIGPGIAVEQRGQAITPAPAANQQRQYKRGKR